MRQVLFRMAVCAGMLAVASAALECPASVQTQAGEGAVIHDDAPDAVVAFDPPVLDFGVVRPNERSMATVRVTNIIDEPIVVKLVFGAGSTTGSWSKLTPFMLPPGDWMDVPLPLNPGPRQGTTLNKLYWFQIEGRPTAVLRATATVPLHIEVVPEILSADPDDPESGTLVLRAANGQAFRILEAAPAIVPGLPTGDEVEHTVRVDWNAWDEAKRPIRLDLATDHPELHQVTVLVKQSVARRASGLANDEIASGAGSVIAAIDAGDHRALAVAILACTDINQPVGRDRRTALHRAAAAGSSDAIVTLLDAGAAVDPVDADDQTPLGLAVLGGHAAAAARLLSAGAAPDHLQRLGNRALGLAAHGGDPILVRLLLDAGADPSASGYLGATPVMEAIEAGRVEIVEMLLSRGADPHARDHFERDALLSAVGSCDCDGVSIDSLRLLIAAGADLDTCDGNRRTPLMIAVGRGDLDIVRLLVEQGASLRSRDSEGETALDRARRSVAEDASPEAGAARSILAFLDQAAPPDLDQPAIELVPPVLDLGELDPGSAVELKVSARNLLAEPVVVREVRAAPWGSTVECGLTIQPGETATLNLGRLVANPFVKRISRTYRIYLESQPRANLPVTATIPTPVDVTPPVVRYDAAHPGPATVKLRATDGTPFRIRAVWPRVEEPLPDEPSVEHEVRLDWDHWLERQRPHWFEIKTDHPGAETVVVWIRET